MGEIVQFNSGVYSTSLYITNCLQKKKRDKMVKMIYDNKELIRSINTSKS